MELFYLGIGKYFSNTITRQQKIPLFSIDVRRHNSIDNGILTWYTSV